jgi:TonB family protein
VSRSSRPLPAALLLASLLVARSARAHDVEPPRLREDRPAPWPEGHAWEHDVVVPLELAVDEDGNVTDATLEASLGEPLDGAALRHARTLRYEPARRDGAKVASRVRAIVRFVGVHGAGHAHPRAVHPSSPHAAPVPSPASGPLPSDAPQAVRVGGAAPIRSAGEVVRDRRVLAAAPHRTASDLLAVVPGLFVTQHSGEGKAHQIFLRGYDAQHGQDVEIWVGGAPINEVSNVHGQGYADLHFVMPEIVRELRAQSGPFDPRQGDFAVAGSVRASLGLEEPGFHVKGSWGSFAIQRYVAAWRPSGAPPETFAAFEGYVTDGFGPARAARRGSLVAQATHDFDGGLSGRVLVTLSTGRFDSAGVVLRRDVESGATDAFATYDPKQGGSSQRFSLVLDLHRDVPGGELGPRERWSLAPYAIVRGLALRSNFTGYLLDPVNGDGTQQKNDAVTVGMNGTYRRTVKLFRPDDAFEVGLSGRYDAIEQAQRRLAAVDDRVTKTEVDAGVHAADVGSFVDVALHALPRTVLRGGLRADVLAYVVDDRLAPTGPRRTAMGFFAGPRATADVAILPELHALASYGMGFRGPQARSLADGQTAPFTTVNAFELGARWQQRDSFAASLAGFHSRLSDDLVFDPATARNERVPATQRTGVAVDLAVRPSRAFTLASSLTYARADFTASSKQYQAGDLVPYAPQLVGRTDVSFDPKLARLLGRDLFGHVGVGLTFLHRRPLPFGEIGRDIFLTDAGVGVRLGEVELDLDVYNLMDDRWFDGEFVYASSFTQGAAPSLVPQRHVTMGAPRTALFSLALHL